MAGTAVSRRLRSGQPNSLVVLQTQSGPTGALGRQYPHRFAQRWILMPARVTSCASNLCPWRAEIRLFLRARA
jgi:hypothetical protein